MRYEAEPGCYRTFQDGVAALVRLDGHAQRESFEVTVASIPHFSDCKTGTCGRMRQDAPTCKRGDSPSPRKEGTIVPCRCSQCGMTYPALHGRRFHPDWPVKAAER